MKTRGTLAILGPGILVAATGVGAGDLATGAFTGAALGTAVLWAVVVGAGLKLVLNEGLTRWQLATGTTLLEGTVRRLGRPVGIFFLIYLLPWTFMVSAALMAGCGATAHAILPLTGSATDDKIVYGLLHGIAGIALVRLGGFRLFERVMSVTIAFMFVTVVYTAARLSPDLGELARGLVVPSIPHFDDGGLQWTIALMGGVGGTVTILCYGYWIREDGRSGIEELGACRLDLTVAYVVTAIFGIAMVIIGSTIEVSGRGVGLIVGIADRLGDEIGPLGKGLFLIGTYGAVASSLLGVWQAVPYLFADLIDLLGRDPDDDRPRTIDTSSGVYRFVLVAMTVIPAIGLWVGFASMQRAYAIIGAMFLPLLALALLFLNGRATQIGAEHRNRPITNVVLVATLIFFLGFLGFVIF